MADRGGSLLSDIRSCHLSISLVKLAFKLMARRDRPRQCPTWHFSASQLESSRFWFSLSPTFFTSQPSPSDARIGAKNILWKWHSWLN